MVDRKSPQFPIEQALKEVTFELTAQLAQLGMKTEDCIHFTPTGMVYVFQCDNRRKRQMPIAELKTVVGVLTREVPKGG